MAHDADQTAASPPTAAATPARATLRETAALLALLLLAAGLHLVRPNRTAHQYAAPLTGPVAYAFNADSAPFARLVVRFPGGFADCEQGRARLMRPLYPAAGWVLYQVLRPAAGLIPDRLAERAAGIAARANHPEIWRGIDGRDLVRAWVALVLLNVFLYGAALLLLFHGLLRLFDRRLAFALALVPAFHFNTIDFVLVPSTEPFNVLVPALVFHAAAAVWPRGRAGFAGAAILGACQLGKGLSYPVVNWLYEHLRGAFRARNPSAPEAPPTRVPLALPLVALALFAAPTLLYLLLVKGLGQVVTYPETEQYRHAVWMADWAREGRVLDIPLRWGMGLLQHGLHLLQGFWAPLLAALALMLRRGRGERRLPAPFLLHLAVYTAACAVFWCLVGYHPPRLAIVQFPLVVTLLGAAAERRAGRPEVWVGTALALGLLARAAGGFEY